MDTLVMRKQMFIWISTTSIEKKLYLDSEVNLRKDKNADFSMCIALYTETFIHRK